MTLGNMRELGLKRLIASCLNDACRRVALIDVWSYPAETEIPYFSSHVEWKKAVNKPPDEPDSKVSKDVPAGIVQA